MLLALCSKNNEEDVVETFRAHPEMPLRLEDFVARRINWETKSANLAALAEELELGLDSFILVDDNPKECTRGAGRRAGGAGAAAAGRRRGDPRIPAARLGLRPRARHRRGPRAAPELYAQRARTRRAPNAPPRSLEEFLASLRTGGAHRAHGARTRSRAWRSSPSAPTR